MLCVIFAKNSCPLNIEVKFLSSCLSPWLTHQQSKHNPLSQMLLLGYLCSKFLFKWPCHLKIFRTSAFGLYVDLYPHLMGSYLIHSPSFLPSLVSSSFFSGKFTYIFKIILNCNWKCDLWVEVTWSWEKSVCRFGVCSEEIHWQNSERQIQARFNLFLMIITLPWTKMTSEACYYEKDLQ